MTAMRREQRAARRVQSECGVNYTKALGWVRNNSEEIRAMVTDADGKTDWRRYNEAAAGLWRRQHEEER